MGFLQRSLTIREALYRQVWIGDDGSGDNDHRVFLWNLKILSTAAAAGPETIYRTNGSSAEG